VIQIYVLTPVFAVLSVLFIARIRRDLQRQAADWIGYDRRHEPFYYWGTLTIWGLFALLCAGAALIGMFLIVYSIAYPEASTPLLSASTQ